MVSSVGRDEGCGGSAGTCTASKENKSENVTRWGAKHGRTGLAPQCKSSTHILQVNVVKKVVLSCFSSFSNQRLVQSWSALPLIFCVYPLHFPIPGFRMDSCDLQLLACVPTLIGTVSVFQPEDTEETGGLTLKCQTTTVSARQIPQLLRLPHLWHRTTELALQVQNPSKMGATRSNVCFGSNQANIYIY